MRKRLYEEIQDYSSMKVVEQMFERPLPPLPTLEPKPKKARKGEFSFFLNFVYCKFIF